MTNTLLHFNTGDTRAVHTINIIDDDICESELEEFTSSISLVNQDSLTNIITPLVRILIDDSTEIECGRNIAQTRHCCSVIV